MSLKRGVITGLGAITPFGPGLNRLFEALLAGESVERRQLGGGLEGEAGEVGNAAQALGRQGGGVAGVGQDLSPVEARAPFKRVTYNPAARTAN